jgi:hypothetical protein
MIPAKVVGKLRVEREAELAAGALVDPIDRFSHAYIVGRPALER